MKDDIRGMYLKSVGSGSEAHVDKVFHPRHGIAARKIYDPRSALNRRKILAAKLRVARQNRGNKSVAELKAHRRLKSGARVGLYEYVPGKTFGEHSQEVLAKLKGHHEKGKKPLKEIERKLRAKGTLKEKFRFAKEKLPEATKHYGPAAKELRGYMRTSRKVVKAVPKAKGYSVWDVKGNPGNVKLLPDGSVKTVDYLALKSRFGSKRFKQMRAQFEGKKEMDAGAGLNTAVHGLWKRMGGKRILDKDKALKRTSEEVLGSSKLRDITAGPAPSNIRRLLGPGSRQPKKIRGAK
jgi:hypothetical protein